MLDSTQDGGRVEKIWKQRSLLWGFSLNKEEEVYGCCDSEQSTTFDKSKSSSGGLMTRKTNQNPFPRCCQCWCLPHSLGQQRKQATQGRTVKVLSVRWDCGPDEYVATKASAQSANQPASCDQPKTADPDKRKHSFECSANNAKNTERNERKSAG